ncbi:hypothetical protein E2C01_053366 [Portunus trituberculatus]|uniref:Uncharacterized protein n=1 Tax=Portunus trituberculatus TaxID=210409 RepID=A0A5B7GQ46_PORTR|nr:hypothetical protein [Portunus trituberculatus]
MRQSLIPLEAQDVPGAHTQNPPKLYPRNSLKGRCHVCNPTGTPKVKNRARGSSCPSQEHRDLAGFPLYPSHG